MGPFRIVRPGKSGTVREVGADSGGGNDEFRFYLDRLLKLIPGEVVSLYLVGAGFIPVKAVGVQIAWSAFCLLMVIVVRLYGTSDPADPARPGPQPIPVIISTVAFVIWLYTLGGPFAAVGLYVPYVGSLLVLAYTFLVPFVYRGD